MTEKSVKQIAMERAIVMLKASGAKFVILTEEGEKITHGEIDAAPTKKKRQKNPNRPIGALIKHYGPYVSSLQPGECATVPRGQFTLKEIRSAVSAYASHKWGQKSAIVASKGDDHVELLRLL